jgi:hypothetical protein
MFYARGIQDELLEYVEDQIKSAEMRKEPTYTSYLGIMKKFIAKATKNPRKNYLQIQSFSCHG